MGSIVGHYVGWLKDKLNKSVTQVWYLQPLDTLGYSYEVVKKRFGGLIQYFEDPVKGKTCLVRASFTTIKDKGRMIQFRDIASGDVINFGGKTGMPVTIEELNALLTSEDVKAASAGGSVYDQMFVIVVGALGLVAGLFIGVLVFPQLLSAMGVSWW